jgi:putative ABC transport system ATP-binding protein
MAAREFRTAAAGNPATALQALAEISPPPEPEGHTNAQEPSMLESSLDEGPSNKAPVAEAAGVPVFAARGLTKVYRMGEVTVQALRGVDFDLFPHEFVVLLGPSGSGKSTLLNILGGLDVPTSGEVVYKDHNLTAAGDAELTEYRRTHVGFVFQFYNLIPSLTARENVALVTDIAEHPLTAEESLAMVGLDHRLDHFPAQLSGGEQQRVAIARAIAKRPDVLLCDEPTGALDITTGIVVLEAIERVNRELGTATVVITHNAAIAGMADRVVRLADGQVAGVERPARKISPREFQW